MLTTVVDRTDVESFFLSSFHLPFFVRNRVSSFSVVIIKYLRLGLLSLLSFSLSCLLFLFFPFFLEFI